MTNFINLDAATQALDPNAQQVIVNAVIEWVSRKTNAPIDSIRLLNDRTDERVTAYEVEADAAGTIEHLQVLLTDDGSVSVQPAE